MITDAELMWDTLSNNHSKLAHVWGRELLDLSKKPRKKKFHNRADECLSATLSWPIEARARAVKTWLSTYKVPLDPGSIHSFDQFHKTTASFVLEHSRTLQSYE